MAESLIIIQQGIPEVLADDVTFLGVGSDGDPSACRRLVFPSSVTTLLAPITYTVAGLCWNPSTTLNLDNVVLPQPRTQVIKTLGTTRLVTFGEGEDDVIVTEIWEAGRGGASMPTSLFRLIYEYWVNQPDFQQTGQQYIQWEPRDRNERTYQVEIVSLSVGGSGVLNVRDIRDSGGSVLGNAEFGVAPSNTGWIDEDVTLELRIVAEVV